MVNLLKECGMTNMEINFSHMKNKTIYYIGYFLVIFLIILFTFEVNSQGVITAPQKSTKAKTKSQNTVKRSSTTNTNPLTEPDGYIDNHGYVDLGLPSGIKWSTCNIGSLSSEDVGNYYSWGETSTKNVYSKLNSRTLDKTKYKLELLGFINSEGNLKPSYDIVYEEWGENWRMPTQSDFQELIEKCNWSWQTTKDGNYGYSVLGPNKKVIFIPIGGYKDGIDLLNFQKYGYYWTSSVSIDENAWSLFIDKHHHLTNFNNRSLGFNVRPVSNN